MACPSLTVTVFECSKSFVSDKVSQDTLKTFPGYFSRISEDMLGSFSASFGGLSVLHCHCD